MRSVRDRLEAALVSGDVPRVSASFGVADSGQAAPPEAVINLADLAMFGAEAAGRDRVVVADDPPTERAPAVDQAPASVALDL